MSQDLLRVIARELKRENVALWLGPDWQMPPPEESKCLAEISSTPLATLLLVAGYDVEMAFDGQTAVETAEIFRPDVCLVDLNVPRLNVYELTRCLRERLPQPPLLANVTPFDERDDWDADAEFDLDFTKPSDPI